MDHSHLEAKLDSRLWAVDALPEDPLLVLDAFAGEGILWSHVREQRPGRDIRVTGIEHDPDRAQPGAIVADNLHILETECIDDIDLIDLDSHGWPHRQLAVISRRCWGRCRVPHVALTRPVPGRTSRTPNDVRDAGGWQRYCRRLGWRIDGATRSTVGAMAYEHLTPM